MVEVKEYKIRINVDSSLRHKYKLIPVGQGGRSTSVVVPWEFMVKIAERISAKSFNEVRKRMEVTWHTAEGFDGLIATFEEKTPSSKKKT